MLLSIPEFIGHLHPLLVHLPIGVLLTGLLLHWLSHKEKNKAVQAAVPVVLLFGAIAAILSCITGYVLSNVDDYDQTIAGWHQWMGISVAVLSLLLYLKIRNPGIAININILAGVLLLLIFITGHLGGSLTHGSDYLTKPLGSIFGKDSAVNGVIKPIPDVQQAFVYSDVVTPILQTRCYSCHGINKQKGKLRMDDAAMLLKGGKDGKVIEPGNAAGSELIKRLLLPVDNEDHMPPKEKPQPSESQIALLQWWIRQGASFVKKVKEVDQPDKIKPLLMALQNTTPDEKEPMDIPVANVEKADHSILEKLNQRGVVILPVAQNNNYLKANFVTDTLINLEDLKLLLQLRRQLIRLKLSFTNIRDTDMTIVGQLQNLTWLNLQNTGISDKGLLAIQSLQGLKYLNLVGTKVTLSGILQLKGLTSLHSLFLYQTGVGRGDWPALKKAFPKTRIDSGGYFVPLLPNDTIIIRAKKKY